MTYRKFRVILFFLPVLVAYYIFNAFISADSISGVYVNRNFGEGREVAETPNVADTLIIYKNGQFTSSFYRDGKYQISHSLSGTSVNFTYKYEFGNAGFEAPAKRLNFTGVKLILSDDLDRYYEKVK